jgi:hypothetical protein
MSNLAPATLNSAEQDAFWQDLQRTRQQGLRLYPMLSRFRVFLGAVAFSIAMTLVGALLGALAGRVLSGVLPLAICTGCFVVLPAGIYLLAEPRFHHRLFCQGSPTRVVFVEWYETRTSRGRVSLTGVWALAQSASAMDDSRFLTTVPKPLPPWAEVIKQSSVCWLIRMPSGSVHYLAVANKLLAAHEDPKTTASRMARRVPRASTG